MRKRIQTVAVAIARDEERYLPEWIAYHDLFGISAFAIYDNSVSDRTRQLLKHLAHHVTVEHIPWHDDRPIWLTVQLGAYQDALKRFSYVDFLAFIDVDEFLHSGCTKSLSEMLESIPCDISAIAVNQRLFGSSGFRVANSELVTARFTSRAHLLYSENRTFKTIVRPSAVKAFECSHSVVLRKGRYVLSDLTPLSRRSSEHLGMSDRRAKSGMRLHHYPLKSLEEFRWKQARWSNRWMSGRYDDDYFDRRDPICSRVIDLALSKHQDEIKQRLAVYQTPAIA